MTATRIALAPDHGAPVEPTPRAAMTTRRKLEVMIWHGRCYICGLKLAGMGDTEFDHIRSLELAGADELDNIAPAHRSCHAGKTALDHKMIAKARRRRKREAGEVKPKRKIPSRPIRRKSDD